ncbi:anti-sigma factor domain-containing protein [uncultured Hydrogenophaga sp.]|uniref:anti-sigma factor n=1 Tax=uncultured Hydrogenophaga sp. TaxID=199683 RepID=UPI00265E4383|nr:anti-sigma factor [uncultured Hydrogenophaga sp.]
MNIARHPELLDRLAAAWAVGTLRGGARRRFEQMAREHPSVRAAALVWQERMTAMTELQPAVQPAPQVWTRIDNLVRAERAVVSSLSGRQASAGTAAPWWQGVRLWQGMGLAGALATVAAIGVALNLNTQLGQTRADLLAQSGTLSTQTAQYAQLQTQLQGLQAELAALPRADYVAVLNDSQASAAVLVTFDPVRRQLNLQRLGPVQEAEDRSLQLWALPPGAGPKSLGVLTRERLLQLVADPSSVRDVPTLAISLEPRGGVPEAGGPTGPVLFKGALIQRQL